MDMRKYVVRLMHGTEVSGMWGVFAVDVYDNGRESAEALPVFSSTDQDQCQVFADDMNLKEP